MATHRVKIENYLPETANLADQFQIEDMDQKNFNEIPEYKAALTLFQGWAEDELDAYLLEWRGKPLFEMPRSLKETICASVSCRRQAKERKDRLVRAIFGKNARA